MDLWQYKYKCNDVQVLYGYCTVLHCWALDCTVTVLLKQGSSNHYNINVLLLPFELLKKVAGSWVMQVRKLAPLGSPLRVANRAKVKNSYKIFVTASIFMFDPSKCLIIITALTYEVK